MWILRFWSLAEIGKFSKFQNFENFENLKNLKISKFSKFRKSDREKKSTKLFSIKISFDHFFVIFWQKMTKKVIILVYGRAVLVDEFLSSESLWIRKV